MKFKSLSFVLTLNLIFTIGISAFSVNAQGANQGNNKTNRLSLQHKNEILQIRSNANQRFIDNIEQLKILENELHELMISETASEREVQEKYLQMRALSYKIMDDEFQTKLAIRDILPPELRAPFAQQLKEALRNASANPTVEN